MKNLIYLKQNGCQRACKARGRGKKDNFLVTSRAQRYRDKYLWGVNHILYPIEIRRFMARERSDRRSEFIISGNRHSAFRREKVLNINLCR